MLKSFLTLAFRNLKRDKSGTLLYFLLLIVGISSFAIITVIYNNEIQFDRFMPDGDKIYRITTAFKRGDQEVKWANTRGYFTTIIEDNIPEVAVATKFQVIEDRQVFRAGEKRFEIPGENGFYTDPDFFEVLDYPLLYGDQATALVQPNSIVISTAFANRFFNKLDVVGETLNVEFTENYTRTMRVTGVLKEIPNNSHLQFNMLISGNTRQSWAQTDELSSPPTTQTYFKTKSTIEDQLALENKIQAAIGDVYNKNGTNQSKYPVQAFLDIHFNADNLFEAGKPGNLLFTRILLAVGIIILIIATVNFSILYTAKSLVKAKEIGIRKTLGSSHLAVGFRLMAESCLLSLLCAVLAVGMAELLLQTVVPSHLYEARLSILDEPQLITLILAIGIVLGVISGTYVTSRSALYTTTQILRGKLKSNRVSLLGGRNLLVIFQFVLTGALITASLVFIKQLRFIKNKDVGYERAAVFSLSRPSNITPAQFDILKQSLTGESAVLNTGYVGFEFLGSYNAGNISISHEGKTLVAKGNSNYIDADLIPTLGMEIVEGRNFSKEIAGDSVGVIINEAAKRVLGIDDVIGKSMTYRKESKIIGVVKDFHFQSFMDEIPPLLLVHSDKNSWWQRNNLMVRVAPQNIQQAMQRVEAKWDEMGSGVPFEPSFLDSSFLDLIEKEAKLSKMITTYTVISIIVACIGLIGIVSYTNEQRKKEVGIRKVYGASENAIMLLINSYFFKLTAVALVIAIPVSFLGIDKWLDSFAYHTTQGLQEYLLAGLLLIGFTLLVTSARTLKTARSNPTEVLKDE